MHFYMTDSLSEFTVTFPGCHFHTLHAIYTPVVGINKAGLYQTIIDILRLLLEPRLRQQAEREKSRTALKGILLYNG